MDNAQPLPIDRPITLFGVVGIAALALFLYVDVGAKQSVLLLIGGGLGFALYHASFGFGGAWRALIRERRSHGVRAQLWLLAATALAFFPFLSGLVPNVSYAGAVAPVGISLLVGAFAFGIGMQLGGGCGSGTLYTVGGGNVRMLITLAFFIVGATVGAIHLPFWLQQPNVGRISLLDLPGSGGPFFGLVLSLAMLAGIYLFVRLLEKRRHGQSEPLVAELPQEGRRRRLLRGYWPALWAVAALVLLNLATLLVAGHPWSITYAFGLWGAKLWQAFGGDTYGWMFWASGYPAQTLGRSVLQETTSLMNFGLLLGALVAAGLAGKYALPRKLSPRIFLALATGGLLLGYGARLAFGCNIGALLGGIASGSLHGWVWLLAAFGGNALGVRLRRPFGLE